MCQALFSAFKWDELIQFLQQHVTIFTDKNTKAQSG